MVVAGCRRCEEAKADFAAAANDLKLNEITNFVFASVDTEVSGELARLTITGPSAKIHPPNFLYFHHGEHLKDFTGPARRKDFVEFALPGHGGGKTKKKEDEKDDSSEEELEKVEEFEWSAFPGGSKVTILAGGNYGEELAKYDAAMVFFRAPGRCRPPSTLSIDYDTFMIFGLWT